MIIPPLPAASESTKLRICQAARSQTLPADSYFWNFRMNILVADSKDISAWEEANEPKQP